MKAYYNLGDRPSFEECQRLNVKRPMISPSWIPPGKEGEALRAKRTDEFRAPKRGEWYLSGAAPLAWKAPNDYLPDMKYRIMKLVVIERKTRETIREVRS